MRYLLGVSPFLTFLALLWGISACDGDGGDGDADSDLDADQPLDCGEVGQSCNMSTECPEDQVCVEHVCGCAYDRNYEVEIMSAAIYSRKSGGWCWDGVEPDCEPPDPYATVKVGEASRTTNTKSDTYNPIWDESFNAYIHRPNPNPTGYWITIMDEDPEGTDEPILEFPGLDSGWPIYIDTLRQGGITVQQGAEKQRTTIKLILAPLPDEEP
jgi:hypothetical protein